MYTHIVSIIIIDLILRFTRTLDPRLLQIFASLFLAARVWILYYY